MLFDFSINRIIRILIISDLLLFAGFGLLSPIFAVFITKQIIGGSLEVVGLTTGIYWLARILTTTPLSRLMDHLKGEKDEFYFMIIGSFIGSILPFFLIFAKYPWHLFIIQGLEGVAWSMAIPAWRILFTHHLDPGKVGYEWSIEDISVGVATAFSAFLGGLIADKFGFKVIFVMVGVLGLIGTGVLLLLLKEARGFFHLRRYHRQKLKAPIKIDTIK